MHEFCSFLDEKHLPHPFPKEKDGEGAYGFNRSVGRTYGVCSNKFRALLQHDLGGHATAVGLAGSHHIGAGRQRGQTDR